MLEQERRICVMCGRVEGDGVEYRSEYAIHCVDCDERRKEYRKTYARLYHRARTAALSRLVDAHTREYDRYLEEERSRLDAKLREADLEKRHG